MKIKVNNAALALSLGLEPFAVVDVEERKGVPKSREWRNRIKDAQIDGCVQIVQNANTARGKTKPIEDE